MKQSLGLIALIIFVAGVSFVLSAQDHNKVDVRSPQR